MKHLLKRILLLSMVIVFSFSLFSCSCENEGKENKGDNSQQTTPKIVIEGDVHEYDVTDDSENGLFVNGQSDYTIVYPEEKHNEYITFMNDFRNLISEATGVSLPMKSDVEFTGSDKILSIGLTKQAENESTLMDKYNGVTEWRNDGFLVETIGNSVYMIAKSYYGNAYAGYEFLKWQFNFQQYNRDYYSLNKNIRDLKLMNFHIKDIPSFNYRAPYKEQSFLSSGEEIKLRTRVTSNYEMMNMVDGNQFAHNVFELMPMEKYQAEHPSWYSLDGKQLCHTARGDADEFNALVDTITYEMTTRLAKDPTRDFIALSPEDGAYVCHCSACTKDLQLYDSESAAYTANYIRLCNAVAKKLKVWNEENCPERHIVLQMFSYGAERMFPVKIDANKEPVLDADGKFQPYSEDLMLEDNICVMVCGNAVGYDPEDEYDSLSVPQADRVVACMKKPMINYWTYSANFQNYFIPENTIYSRADNYRWIYTLGAICVFDQGEFNSMQNTDWSSMYQFVCSKLMWNISLDTETLIKEYMENVYQDVSAIMYDIYTDLRINHFQWLHEEYGYNGSAANKFLDKKYWPYSKIIYYKDRFNAAYDAIEGLKEKDPKLYQLIYDRIAIEQIQYRYLEVKLYPDYFDYDELKRLQADIIADCRKYDISRVNEHVSIEALF